MAFLSLKKDADQRIAKKEAYILNHIHLHLSSI